MKNQKAKKVYKIQYKYPSGKIEEIFTTISNIDKFEQCRKRLETLAKYSYCFPDHSEYGMYCKTRKALEKMENSTYKNPFTGIIRLKPEEKGYIEDYVNMLQSYLDSPFCSDRENMITQEEINNLIYFIRKGNF